LATLAVYRDGINAFLTAAISEAEESPGGLMMPNQSLLYAGRVHACSGLAEMMHVTRDLCGGQICVTPDFASFTNPETAPWLEKFYTISEDWQAEDRRKLLAYARDLLNSDYAGHRLTFQLFAQSPPFAHLLAVYRNFDFAEPMRIVRESAGLSHRVQGGREVRAGNGVNPNGKTAEIRDTLPASPTQQRVPREGYSRGDSAT
jgi:4-hydroxyphenylacetate 3-monooxygenase